MPKVKVTYGIYTKEIDVPEGTTLDELEKIAQNMFKMPEEVSAYVYKEENVHTNSRSG